MFSLLQLLNSAIVECSLRKYVNKWMWMFSNKTLFTKSRWPDLVHVLYFADLWHRVSKECGKYSVVILFTH